MFSIAKQFVASLAVKLQTLSPASASASACALFLLPFTWLIRFVSIYLKLMAFLLTLPVRCITTVCSAGYRMARAPVAMTFAVCDYVMMTVANYFLSFLDNPKSALHKRLQQFFVWLRDVRTASLLFLLGNLFGNAPIVIFLMFFWAGLTWILIVPLCVYICYIILSNAHKRTGNEWFRLRQTRMFKAVFDYFPLTIRFDQELDPSRQYIVGIHPHGIFPWSVYHFLFNSSEVGQRFPWLNCLGLVASVLFHFPLVREASLLVGLVDASRAVATDMLSQKRNIFIIVGGEAETLLTTPGKEMLVLQHRKGFVRLALQHGVDLVPTYSFGQNDVYKTLDLLIDLRKWFAKKFKMCIPLFYGRYMTPVPYRRPITTVVGEPIAVTHIEQPTTEEVDQLHARYIEALKSLFEKHKHSVGFGDRELVIV